MSSMDSPPTNAQNPTARDDMLEMVAIRCLKLCIVMILAWVANQGFNWEGMIMVVCTQYQG